MFDAVAERYDVTNDVLSLGQDRRWRNDVIDAVAPQPGERVLDLAAGTGTSSQPFADAGATVVPCDFSLGMLQVGKQAQAAPAVHRRRRHPAAVRRRHLRRGHDLVRAAQHRRPAGRAPRDAPGDPARRPPGRLRVQPPDVGAVPHPVRRVPHEGAPAHRPRGVLEPRRLRLPRRVDPRLARPAGPGRRDRRRRLAASASGATSPAASSRCTAPPPDAHALPVDSAESRPSCTSPDTADPSPARGVAARRTTATRPI